MQKKIFVFVLILLLSACSNQNTNQIKAKINQNFTFEPGNKIGELTLVKNQKQETIDFSDGKFILFLLDEECQICKMNMKQWDTIKKKLSNKFTILYISISKKYNFTTNSNYPFYRPKETDFMMKHKILELPQTIVIINGRIVNNFGGYISDKRNKYIIKKISKY